MELNVGAVEAESSDKLLYCKKNVINLYDAINMNIRTCLDAA